MTDELNPVNDPVKQLTAIPWYDATTMRALLVAAIGFMGHLASFFGIDEAVFDAKAPKLIDDLLTLITLGGIVWAGIARARQPTPPIKLTRAKADDHNSTILPETLNATIPTVQPSSPTSPTG